MHRSEHVRQQLGGLAEICPAHFGQHPATARVELSDEIHARAERSIKELVQTRSSRTLTHRSPQRCRDLGIPARDGAALVS